MVQRAYRQSCLRAMAGVLCVAALLATTNSLRAIECPVAHATNTPSAIKEPKRMIKEYGALMTAQGDRVVPEIMASLKKRHPKVSDAEITNYLVTLFCPIVDKDAALSDGQKAQLLTSFSSRLMRELATP